MIYIFYLVTLFITQLVYLKIADRYNIIDKPNHRSSHSEIIIRGGGIVFPVSVLIWFATSGFQYPFFVAGLLLVAIVSFIDDIREFSKRMRLLAQLLAMVLVLIQLNMTTLSTFVIIGIFIFFIGAINAYNFMDGINGITGMYSLVALLTLLWINIYQINFIDTSLILSVITGVAVFNFFNSRPRAKCFAGDVGSISIAFIICFLLMKLILQTSDIRYILLLIVYGIDTMITIAIRSFKRENIFVAHRSHLYQLLVNEQKYKHLTVAVWYSLAQAIINVVLVNGIAHNTYKLSATFVIILIVLYISTRIAINRKRLSKTSNI